MPPRASGRIDSTRIPGLAVTDVMIRMDAVGKTFCRSRHHALWYGVADAIRQALGRPRRPAPRAHEFWALDGVSITVRRGECLGVIGPNGAGKSTLLKLIARDYRPDRGSVQSRGRLQSLLRLGSGLQPMLTGRENVYVKCSQLGLSPSEVDARMSGIVDFAGLHEAIDRPVRHYSDGMYARLDFAIATSGPVDVLLVDEVLAVGDIAFQKRCLDRLNALKRAGTAVVLVSHAEMNVRYVADRCLLLLDGKPVAFGDTEAVIRKYHEAVGYLNAQGDPFSFAIEPAIDGDGAAAITRLQIGPVPVSPGDAIRWTLEYRCAAGDSSLGLVLQFWNTADLLVASIDSRYSGPLCLTPGTGRLLVGVSFLGLAPGRYRVAGGFVGADGFVSYGTALAVLHVSDSDYRRYGGLTMMPAALTPLTPTLD